MYQKSGLRKRMRRVETEYFWAQTAVGRKEIVLMKEDTETNVADLGTESLDGPWHHKLLAMLPHREPRRRLLEAAGVELN